MRKLTVAAALAPVAAPFMLARARLLALATISSLLLLMATPSHPALATPGDLDPTFGEGGKVASDLGLFFELFDDAVLDPDGRIVAVGLAEGLFAAIVARYLPDGTLDSSFSGDGFTTLDDPFGDGVDAPGGVGVQGTGRIVVGISTACGNDSCWVIAGYEPDGDLDPSFGTGGLTVVDPPGDDDFLTDLVVGADDEITAVGYVRGGRRFGVARLGADGLLDPGFGGTGMVTMRFIDWPSATAESVGIDSEGRVVAAGAVCRTFAGIRCAFAVARLNPDGTLNQDFSGDGKRVIAFPLKVGAYGRGVAVMADDRIIMTGEVFDSTRRSMFGTVRLLVDGRLDKTFSVDGRVKTEFSLDRRDGGTSVALQGDGRILVAGFAGGFHTDGRFAVIRYRPRGTNDKTFGGDGKVTTRFNSRSSPDRVEALLVQPNGRIIAAGMASFGEFQHLNQMFGFARYLAA